VKAVRIVKTLIVLTSVLFFAPKSGSGSPAEQRLINLDNGLRVYLYSSRAIPLVTIAAGFDAGVKHETPETNGLIHLIEHCLLFRSSPEGGQKPGVAFNNAGAYFNAYTGRDLTIFEISAQPDEIKALLVPFRELIFSFDLAKEEFEAEKKVILEEINQIKDDPFRFGLEYVSNRVFEGHPYSLPVYGNPEVIKNLSMDKVISFYRENYLPSRCVLAVTGDFGLEAMEKAVRQVFGPLEKSAVSYSEVPMVESPKKQPPFKETMDTANAHLFLALPAPDFNSSDQYAIDVLTEILGRGANPLLLTAMRGRGNFPLVLNMYYLADLHGGAIIIYEKLEAGNVQTAKNVLTAYLKNVANESFSASDFSGPEKYQAFDFLEGAKSAIAREAAGTEESGLRLAESLVRFLLLNKRENPAAYLDQIMKIKSSDLRKAAFQYLAKGRPVVLTIMPAKSTGDGQK